MYASVMRRFSSSTEKPAHINGISKMDAPTIQPKFLSKPNELGLVAVGFSGGQVSKKKFPESRNMCLLYDSANQVSTPHPWHLSSQA